MLRLILIGIFLLTSCSNEQVKQSTYVTITGREPERIGLYQIKIPNGWKTVYPDPNVSLIDSRLPLLECFIDEYVRITIHNFPAENSDQQIPPQAQIQRWKQQLKKSDPTATVITPQSFSGYTGFLLEAEGELDAVKSAIMGWALQLGSDHYRNLSYTNFPNQMRAEITIKVTGPPEIIALHRMQILKFARSFELIEEIPIPR